MPPALQEIIALLQHLPEHERREALIAYAEAADTVSPKPQIDYCYQEVRRDSFCSDIVGVHIQKEDSGRLHFAISLGPKVQTLTRALAVILSRGLDGCYPIDVLSVSSDVVSRIVGSELVRLRSKTVYYILERIQELVKKVAPVEIPSQAQRQYGAM
jgi:cysteine desulfuration protein SufE